MAAPLALLALLIELVVGYPDAIMKKIGHPVTWMGHLIGFLDKSLNKDGAPAESRRRTGAIALFVLILVVGAIAFIAETALLLLPFGLIFAGAACSTLIAQRSLYMHVANVADALESSNLVKARKEVAHIVGRDTAELDEAGVARAAIESLAENFSDGVVSPVLWIWLAGLTGGAVYKAINTADSMIGHRSERYESFGKPAAQLDDLVNLPGSRASGLLIVAAPAAPGTRWCAMPENTPRPMPATRKRPWPARSTCLSAARTAMTARRPTARGSARGGAISRQPTSKPHSTSTAARTGC
jgi:adenosylcobinamide-phosphate synthase